MSEEIRIDFLKLKRKSVFRYSTALVFLKFKRGSAICNPKT